MAEKKKEEKKEKEKKEEGKKKEEKPDESASDVLGQIWRGFGRFISVLAFIATCISCYGVYSESSTQPFNPKLRYILYFYGIYVYYTFYRKEPITEMWSILILIINAGVILFYKIDADIIISKLPPKMAGFVNKINFHK
jgi:hypothetical protein